MHTWLRSPVHVSFPGCPFYKDWGCGQPVVFSHGWPLTADVWDGSANFVASHGFRAVAHDRRGGGRSSQPWDGNDLDHYADVRGSSIGFGVVTCGSVRGLWRASLEA